MQSNDDKQNKLESETLNYFVKTKRLTQNSVCIWRVSSNLNGWDERIASSGVGSQVRTRAQVAGDQILVAVISSVRSFICLKQ
jgi:hypothetical protein